MKTLQRCRRDLVWLAAVYFWMLWKASRLQSHDRFLRFCATMVSTLLSLLLNYVMDHQKSEGQLRIRGGTTRQDAKRVLTRIRKVVASANHLAGTESEADFSCQSPCTADSITKVPTLCNCLAKLFLTHYLLYLIRFLVKRRSLVTATPTFVPVSRCEVACGHLTRT